MVSNQHQDPQDAPESPAPRKRRWLPRPLHIAFVVAGLAAVAGFIQIRQAPKLKWYVSPPVDAKGRRIHILIPVGWELGIDRVNGKQNDAKGLMQLQLWPDRKKPEATTLVQKLLTKLSLFAPDEPKGSMVVEFGPDVCKPWNPINHPDIFADGIVRVVKVATLSSCRIRAMTVPGTDKQALVVYYSYERKRNRDDMAAQICRSMYVK